jgi:hypothetical protein
MPKLKSRSGGLDTGGKETKAHYVYFILFFLVERLLLFFMILGTFLNCQEKQSRSSFAKCDFRLLLLQGHEKETTKVIIVHERHGNRQQTADTRDATRHDTTRHSTREQKA